MEHLLGIINPYLILALIWLQAYNTPGPQIKKISINKDMDVLEVNHREDKEIEMNDSGIHGTYLRW